VTRRAGSSVAFITLRDVAADMSLSLVCAPSVCDACDPPISKGARVVAWAQPRVHPLRGTLALETFEFRPVGVGELLARVERLKRTLAVEGLFAADRKRRLPFLPRGVGVITGRDSAAARDVVENGTRRWPAVRFVVREVAVQGPGAAGAVIAALRELDRDPSVDVIVIARGGGSVQDLLPFSDEALCRAVAAAATPVVSAIGHEQDTPLLDLVADVRASTPTDAAKRVVPDIAEEVGRIAGLRRRAHGAVAARLDGERRWLAALRSRPVLAQPLAEVDRRTREVRALSDQAHRLASLAVAAEARHLAASRARVSALSPAQTLARGYAVVQRRDGSVVRDAADVADRDELGVRLARGRLDVSVQARSVD
ncbi:MAG: exodeoxyribonuclease VII large subunit, partial [Frankia sp.]|nr:exodeoxyribonuclease VII large subunit [Frankia sp.]